MILWLIFACLVLSAVLAVSYPLFRREGRRSHGVDDVDVYAAQLSDIDRDLERGLLTPQEAEETRTEIARRLLKARKALSVADRPASGSGPSRPGLLYGSVAGFVSLASLGLYLTFGNPDLPSYPLAARLDGPAEAQSIDVLVAKVEKRLAERPDDGMGWSVIAPVYFKQGRFDDSAEAYRRAIALLGETPEKLLGLGEALSYANNGIVTDDAGKAFQAALGRDPSSVRARFWLALRDEQNGKIAEAKRAYEALLTENVPEAWKRVLNVRIAGLASPSAARPQAGPAASSSSAGTGAQATDQTEFIRSMVAGLAGRLEQNGSDLNGWLMLVRSYAVLGEMDKAKTAFASAKENFQDKPEAIKQLEDLARSLGLVS